MKRTIFISYRREGGEGFAQMFSEKLAKKKYRVFYDIESIGAGLFDQKILREIEQTDVFLLILTKNALDRCLHDGDWVRCEIAHALQLGKPIIPLFFRGFEFPEQLPEDIEKIRFYNGVDIRDMNYFDAKFKQLCALINEAAKPERLSAPVPRAVAPKAPPLPKTEAPQVDPILAQIQKAQKFYDLSQKVHPNANFLFPSRYSCRNKKDYYLLTAAELGHGKALSYLQDRHNHIRITPAGKTRLDEARRLYAAARANYCAFAKSRNPSDHWVTYRKFMELLQESATLGYLPAQFMLAELCCNRRLYDIDARSFLDENRLFPNLQLAFYWYSQAAKQGAIRAYVHLGSLCRGGFNGKKDPNQAFAHFRYAAEHGDMIGQYQLGYCYQHGLGVKADLFQARHWYSEAAAQGHEESQRLVVELSDKL